MIHWCHLTKPELNWTELVIFCASVISMLRAACWFHMQNFCKDSGARCVTNSGKVSRLPHEYDWWSVTQNSLDLIKVSQHPTGKFLSTSWLIAIVDDGLSTHRLDVVLDAIKSSVEAMPLLMWCSNIAMLSSCTTSLPKLLHYSYYVKPFVRRSISLTGDFLFCQQSKASGFLDSMNFKSFIMYEAS